MHMQSEEEEFVITKFKRYGQPITKKSLERTIVWLREKQGNSIDVLLKKLSQLSLESNKLDQNLQHAIEILSMKNRNLNSYEELIEDTRKRSIYPISPYELNESTWFTERPQKGMFEFIPEDKLKMSNTHYKRISEANKNISNGGMLGVIYENYSNLTAQGKPKLMLQNEVNQVELNIPNGFVSNSLLVSGCVYIAKGKHQGKDLTFTVSDFALPNPVPQEKNSLLKQKFRQMCHNISSGKDSPGFEPVDFLKYDCVYTPLNGKHLPILIFGNVTINQNTMKRLQKLVSGFPLGISALILLLSQQEQQSMDFGIWFKCKVFLVPNISSDGPRLLPKLPLLKNRMSNAKILTNPASFCIQGKQVVFVNYPLIRSIYTNCLHSQEIVKLQPQEMTSKVADLIFSQGSISLAQHIYWKQNNYFLINSDTTIIINDNVAANGFQKNKGVGGMATTGNFQRDGEFFCLMSKVKDYLQTCQQPTD